MRKHILLLLTILCTFSAIGQNKIYYAAGRTTDTAFTPGAWLLNGVMRATYYTTSDTNKVLGINSQGFLVLRTKGTGSATIDSNLYSTVSRLRDTSAVLRALIGTGGLDTTSLSNRIDARVKYTDTATMLLPYALLTELPSIVGKVNYTDTAAMLSPYLRKADTTAMLAPYATEANLADTAAVLRGLIPTGTDTTSLSNRIDARVKYTDTAAMLLNYSNFGKSKTGTGPVVLENGPALILPSITAIQVVAGIASLPTGTGTLMYRGDTTAMLTPYLRKADTTAMLAPYYRTATATAALALKVNYTDTAAMLAPYLRDADTASLSTRINLKVDSIRRQVGTQQVQMKINGTWVNAYTDSVGSGGGGTTDWAITKNALVATGQFGSSTNFGIDFFTNNTVIGKVYTNGAWAIGELATCGGFWNLAMGYGATTGSANHSIAIGISTQSLALRSVAFGANSVANATDAIVISSGTGRTNNSTGVTMLEGYNGIEEYGLGVTVKIGRISGIINISAMPVYADNTAALAGGLVAGDLYRTSTGDLRITY